MKPILILLITLFVAFSAIGQDHVFILVDASGSMKASELASAKTKMIQLLTTGDASNMDVMGEPNDLKTVKLEVGDVLYVSSFGDLNRTKNISPVGLTITNVGVDVRTALNAFPSPSDSKTYFRLAKAKIAEFAKTNKLTKYKLYILSDEVTDNFGSNGQANYSDPYIEKLVDEYETTLNPVKVKPSTKVLVSKRVKINFIPEVDISKYSLPGAKTQAPTPPTAKPKIILTSYANGKIGHEVKTKENSFNVAWSCPTCPPNTKFKVSLRSSDGGGFKPLSFKGLSGPSYKFQDIPAGKYMVMVSAKGINTAKTLIEVPSSGCCLWWILLLILLLAAGYYYWNKKREDKINEKNMVGGGDVFQPTSSENSTESSFNSDYF